MRTLTAVVIIAALAWGVYWYVGASAVENGLRNWIEQRRTEGWLAEYTTLNTRGFPHRFDTTITDLELADPRSAMAWSMPSLRVISLSYRPNHIIAIWPKEQIFASPWQKITMTSDDMRASLVFEPGTALTLQRSSFVLGNVSLSSSLGWTASLESGEFHTRQTVGVENAHDIYFEARNLRPSDGILAALDPARALPDVFTSLKIDGTVAFDAPWDRTAIERRRPQPTALKLRLAQASWGALELKATGDLEVRADGTPEGQIMIKAVNWREMLQIGVSTGLVPENLSMGLERALEVLAGMSGSPKTLDAPLAFRNGRVFLGPIPLGPAPRLQLR
jgi:hypothetical protein